MHKKRKTFPYLVKTISQIIKALDKQNSYMHNTRSLEGPIIPKRKDFENEYQVFQIVENEVHKGNKYHTENVKKIKGISKNPLDEMPSKSKI